MNMFARCKMLTLVTCGGKIILSSHILVPNIIATLLYIDFVYYKNILRH